MDVSIIIVNFNTKQLTQDCINSVFEKTTNIVFEIILIDNASTDGSADIFRLDNRIIFVESEENLGFGRANNLGIKIANGRNIFFLNPDTLLINNAVKTLSDFLDIHSKIGVSGANLVDKNLTPIKSFSRFLPGLEEELNDLTGHRWERLCYGKNTFYNYTRTPLQVAFIVGADMMVKRSVLDIVGSFDKDFFLFYEETELSYRIKMAGYSIFSVPDAQLIHLVSKSFNVPEVKLNAYYLSRQIYYRKIYSPIKISILNWIFILHRTTRILIARIFHQDDICRTNQAILHAFRNIRI
jgi:GT2 family glycosyltransferase